jgi:hypothetical protein
MKPMIGLTTASLLLCAVVQFAPPVQAQIAAESAFSEFDLDSAPPDLDRYIVEDDLIAFFDDGFGAALEGGLIDPNNGVESYNFNFMGCLEQWDGIENAFVSPVDCFWHGFGPGCTAAARMLDITDGTGIFGVILRDFARAANVLRFDFDSPTDIGSIRVWTEDNSKGVRAFMHYDVYVSYDESLTDMTLLAKGVRNGEFGITTNAGVWNSSYTEVYNCTDEVLASGVTNIRFVFYCVGTDGGDLLLDPWRGYNPDLNGPDWLNCEATYPADPEEIDGRQKAFVAPNLAEIDILAPQARNADGDVDGDSSVTQSDAVELYECVNGPGNGPNATLCIPLDYATKDCDVDMADVAAFQAAVGP